MSSPARTIRPFRARRTPLTARRTVDLPAPFGPTMQVIEPRWTSRSTPWRTSPPPYPPTTPSRVSSASGMHRFLHRPPLAQVGVEHDRVSLDLRGGAFR